MNRFFIIIVFFLHIFGHSQADQVSFTRLSVEEGLSQSSAFAVVQDSLGFIWVGTYDGLNKYDGYGIKTYKHDPEDSKSICDNYVQSLCVDPNGLLWVGSNDQGICLYNQDQDQFTPLPANSGFQGRSVLALKMFDKNTIVALTEKGVNMIDIHSLTSKLIRRKDYNAMKDKVDLTSYFNPTETTDGRINTQLIDRNGDVWKGTQKGLIRNFSSSNKTILYENRPYDRNSISSNEITCILEDNGGVLWFGTSLGGVCRWERINEGMRLFRNDPMNSNSLSSSRIRCFYEEDSNRVWIGTVDGGVNLWLRNTDEFIQWNVAEEYTNIHIRDILKWDGLIVLATDGHGLLSYNKKTRELKPIGINGVPKNVSVWDIELDRNGLWIACRNFGVLFLKDWDAKTNAFLKSNSYINSMNSDAATWITKDSKGNIWAGTFGDGLFQLNGKVKNWNTSNSNLSDDRIYSIVEDAQGNILLGTKGGVNIFDGQNFESYSVSDGLPNGTVMGIVPSTDGGIWMSTNSGICHFYPENGEVTNYSIHDGLQNNEFLVHSFLELNNGEILFGGINGFNIFPSDGLVMNTYQPKTIITDFTVHNSSWFADSSIFTKEYIYLEHDQNEIDIEFAALTYADPEKTQYMYFMEGFDRDWKTRGTRRFVQYTNLPPGKYVFHVKASNNSGVWSEKETSIVIIIHPAFWQTKWFRWSVGIALILLVVAIYKVRVRRIQRRNAWLEKEVDIRTEEVVSQKKEIEEKNQVIEEALHDIKDSITYAKRIQNAILPTDEIINELLPENFVSYIPKDIVAGDFYWIEKVSAEEKLSTLHSAPGTTFLAAADCTGHGVPGAMVSVVCNNALNRSVREYGLNDPGKILDKTRELVIQEFEQSDESVRDGMDIALVSLSLRSPSDSRGAESYTELSYAGAHNPLWIIRKGGTEIEEIKADKQPIGNFEKATPFQTGTKVLNSGDSFYIFSDGYADQFGGETGKKFKTKNFKKFLLSIQNESMAQQKILLEKMFHDWKGNYEQLDDVCIIGVKV